MRAKFIYEKFTEDSDPVHDMGIGISIIVEIIRKRIKRRDGYWHVSDDMIFNECITSSTIKIEEAISVMQYLINSNKVNINQQGNLIYFLIRIEEGNRMKIMLKFILDHKYKPSVSDLQNAKYRIRYGYKNAKYIHDTLVDVGIKQKNKEILNYLMLQASKKSNVNEIKKLIGLGADPSYKNHYILQAAIRHKDKQTVEFLLKYLEKDPKYK